MTKEEAVQEYQCPGCVNGPFPECYKQTNSPTNIACYNHAAGTNIIPYVGLIFLGMPKGFNRLGSYRDMKIDIFNNYQDSWTYNKFNIPVWKYLDNFGNTIVRGISPRINDPFLHVILENCLDIIDCYQITEKDLEEMD